LELVVELFLSVFGEASAGFFSDFPSVFVFVCVAEKAVARAEFRRAKSFSRALRSLASSSLALFPSPIIENESNRINQNQSLSNTRTVFVSDQSPFLFPFSMDFLVGF